jgi:hypothetical protein
MKIYHSEVNLKVVRTEDLKVMWAEIQNELNERQKELSLQSDDRDEYWLLFKKQNGSIHAVVQYRARHGGTLLECKKYIDSL